MAIGERIHHFRLLRGFTQKYLGQQLGFSESQADVRIAQYEKGARSPKENYLNALADIFDVSPHALAVPDIDSYVGLMHTLFTLEDLYGLHIGEIDGELCLRLDREQKEYQHLFEPFHAWQQMAAKLESGEISQEEYDNWRYNYPEMDTSEIRAKVPFQELSAELIKASKKENQERNAKRKNLTDCSFQFGKQFLSKVFML